MREMDEAFRKYAVDTVGGGVATPQEQFILVARAD